jgi:hypothetical protein
LPDAEARKTKGRTYTFLRNVCGKGCAPAPCPKGFRAPENHDEEPSCSCDHDEGLSRPCDHDQPCAGWMAGTVPPVPSRGCLVASYHLSAAPIKRSAGRSVVAAAAYRAADVLHDGYELHDYRRKSGVFETAILGPDNAPEWAFDRERLWNAVEGAEKRGDAQLAREVRLALPCELTDEQRADLVFNYCRDVFVKDGMIADVSIHRPDRHGDQRNHHAHVLLTMREIDGDGFAATKQRAWNRKEALQEWREKWEVYSNRALEAAGSENRVDHRSFRDRGLEYEGTVHLGPKQSGMERRGVPSQAGDYNRHVEEYNALLKERAALEAATKKETVRISSPPTTPEDAKERLQDDKPLYAAGVQAAARLENDLPADRMTWGGRMVLFVARKAKSIFDRIADKALRLRNLDPERRKRQQPTGHDRRWQEHARQQAEKNKGRDI